jgi:hypothetical protein
MCICNEYRILTFRCDLALHLLVAVLLSCAYNKNVADCFVTQQENTLHAERKRNE